MRTSLILLAVSAALAGCVAAPAPEAPLEVAAASVDPTVFEWKGRVLDSQLDLLSHVQPTEQLLWPVQQEGFLYAFDALPEAFEVALEWDAPGEFMIMLHSHKAHGTNVYAEHITEMTADGPACLRVPAEDFVEGEWQIMVHSSGARNAGFTVKVITVGGESRHVDSEFHGHWLQDGLFEVEERKHLPCEIYAQGA